jgi:hypothetical protein
MTPVKIGTPNRASGFFARAFALRRSFRFGCLEPIVMVFLNVAAWL